MRKWFWLLLLFAGAYTMAADVESIKALILEKLILLLTTEKAPTIFVENECTDLDFPVRRLGSLVPESGKAKVIVTCDIDRSRPPEGYRESQVVITLSYRDYTRHVDRAAGAFFWQKGRPNIIINARYLRRTGIRVPASYEPYVE